MKVLVTGGAGYIRVAHRPGARGQRPRAGGLRQPRSRPSGGGPGHAAPRGRPARPGGPRPGAGLGAIRGGAALRGPGPRGRVGGAPRSLLPQQHVRDPEPAGRDASAAGRQDRVLVDLRNLRRPGQGSHGGGSSAEAGEPVRPVQARRGVDAGGPRHRVRNPIRGPAVLQRRRLQLRRANRRGSRPGAPPDPSRAHGRHGRDTERHGPRKRLGHAGRDVYSETTSTSRISRTRMSGPSSTWPREDGPGRGTWAPARAIPYGRSSRAPRG